LEALFSTSSEDLTYKLRIRISFAGTDYDPDFLYDFVGKAYGVRSRLVHGKVGNNASDLLIVINSKKYGLYDVAN